MPRERKTSTSDDSDGGSSSDETSGSSSSAADRVERDHKKKTKTDSAVRSKGNESNQARSKRSENSDKDDDKELRKKEKNVSDSGELSSSDGERIPRSGPKSTVVQKMTTPSKEKSRKRDEVEKATQEDESTKEKSREKHESADTSRSKKRSRSPSPRNRNVDKRFKDDWSYDRSSGRRDDHRSRRDDRDSERDRNWRRDSDRRRMDDRKRDDERRSDRSRRDVGRDRSDRRRDRDAERKDDHNSEREGGEKKREKDNKENDKGDSRHEEAKKDTSSELQKSKTAEVNGEKVNPEPAPSKKPKDPENIMNRTGGAYIPPAKLRMMQAEITDKSSEPFQRMAWEALRKSINGLINKVNVSNIIDIVRELFQENIVRGRGLLARSMIQAQAASPTFTHVYAALVAIINTKFPQIGNLILQRLILQFKRGYRRNDKTMCLSSSRFISHLVNQQVAHELVSLEILTLLLENVTEDSVEVAISLLKECGQKLTEVSPRGVNAIFERLRSVLHEGTLEKRVQYMVEVMFAIRKDGFKDHPSIISDLDLVEEDDQFTHLLQLDEVTAGMEQLNVFKADDNYLENEDKYKELKKEILDEGSTDDEGSEGELGSDDSSDEDEDEEEEEGKQDIVDQTETNMVALRRTIYLTIQSSLDYEECAHKLLKMELKPGQETELCYMIVDCCAQLRTYEKFFGLLAQRFCHLDKKYMDPFQNIFREQFETIHRLETNKLRNVAKFFAHLLHTDAISWSVMSCMKLTEEDTTSASRIYIKILFLELSEYLGLPKLNSRLRDPTLQECFGGILPRNNPKDTRFAINFFTTIGLGGLTEDLREHLKGISKQLMQQKQQQEQQLQQKEASSSSSDSSDSDSSDSDSSDSSDSGSSESSDSDSDDSESSSEPRANKKKKKKKNPKVTKTRSPRTHSPRDHRKADQPDERRFQRRPESAQQVNGRGSESRPRIVDKLLELSLPKGMSLVDPPDLENWNKRGQDKHKKMSRRNRHSNAERSQRRRNSDRELHGMGSYEQGPDRSYYHGERDDIRGRAMSPLPLTVRQGRQQDGFDILADRRGNRRDLSPVGAGSRRDLSDRHDNYPRRSDRRDLDLTPPPRGMDRHAMASPPVRQDRRDYTSPPPSRHQDRMDMITGIRDSYDRRNLDIVPLQLDRRNMDSPARYQNSRDPESPSHNPVRRRDALSPPLRAGRREMESPSCRIDSNVVDSPPKRAGRGDLERDRDDLMRNIERGRDVERGRGDLPRSLERGRAEMDRSRGRGDADRGLERGRRDRVDADRAMDRRMDVDRNLEQGRGNVDRLIERGRGDLDRSLDRPRGDLDRSMDRVRSDVDRGIDRTRVEMDRIMDRARVDVDRGLDRSRGDMDRGMDRARVDGDRAMERVRGDLDHNIDRGRGDVERVRLDLDRSRIDLDRRRGLDRNLDRSGRGELDNSPPSDRRDMPPSPPLANRREMGHTEMLRNADRRRGLDEQQYGEIDGRGGRRSASPAVRKKVRARNEDSLHRRSSVSRDVEEKRKPSGRTEQEVSRERIREKRRR